MVHISCVVILELHHQDPVSIQRPSYLRMAISMLKIRRPLGRLIFNMGIAIPGKTVFLIETAPRSRYVGDRQSGHNDTIYVLFLPKYPSLLLRCARDAPLQLREKSFGQEQKVIFMPVHSSGYLSTLYFCDTIHFTLKYSRKIRWSMCIFSGIKKLRWLVDLLHRKDQNTESTSMP